MYNLLANVFTRQSVGGSVRYARLGAPFCAYHSCAFCIKTRFVRRGTKSRVFSSFSHNSKKVSLSDNLSQKAKTPCLLATSTFVCSGVAMRSFTNVISTAVTVKDSIVISKKSKRIRNKNPEWRAGPYEWKLQQIISRGKTCFAVTSKVCNNQETENTFLKDVSLFSVDQIREQESPWKAVIDMPNTDRSVRRGSPFKRRLQERKKICMLYGNLPKRILNRYLKEIHKPEDLFVALESRLDVVLKRSAFFPSIQSARHSILKGGVSVNRTKVCSPRYHCAPGDVIQIIQTRTHFSKGRENTLCAQALLAHRQQWKQGPNVASKTAVHFENLNKCVDLFFFSELLRHSDQKAGRFYTSVFADDDKNNIAGSWQKRKKGLPVMDQRFQVRVLYPTAGWSAASDNQPAKNNATYTKAGEIPTVTTITVQERVGANTVSTPSSDTKVTSVDTKITFGLHKDYLSKDGPNHTEPFAREKVELDRFLADLYYGSSGGITSRPLHLEVSYRDLCVVFLYPPQRVCMDVLIDLSLLV